MIHLELNGNLARGHMRNLYCNVEALGKQVSAAVAKLSAYGGWGPSGHGPSPAGCVRAYLLSDGVEESAIAEKYYDPPLINIIKYACHACPGYTHYEGHATPARGAWPVTAPRLSQGAIHFEHGQAQIDQTKLHQVRPVQGRLLLSGHHQVLPPLPGGLRHGRHRQGRPRPGPDQL